MSEQPLVKIYTDGSAHYKTKYGAWAFIVVYPDGTEKSFSHPYEVTTNNQMELMAVLEALDFILKENPPEKHGGRFRYQIISDSEYVVNGINAWRLAWRLKAWKNVKNLVLWRAIDTAVDTIADSQITLKVTWVKGHAGDKYNEKCDKLAHGEYDKLRLSKEKETKDEV